MRAGSTRVHGSCVARDGSGVLILGAPGAGKSDLTLRLLGRGFSLVADDQVDIRDGFAQSPEALRGLLEVRGLGLVRLPCLARVKLHLVVVLADQSQTERLPMPELHPALGVAVVRVYAASASAPDRVALALDCALGHVTQLAGSFAA
jgi:HPr kinase/phosphorylase